MPNSLLKAVKTSQAVGQNKHTMRRSQKLTLKNQHLDSMIEMTFSDFQTRNY